MNSARTVTTAALSFSLLVIFVGCSPQPASVPVISTDLIARSTVPDPAAESCAACHRAIVDEWLTSQHANANRLVSDEKDRAAFDPASTLKHGSFATTMSRSGKDRFTFKTVFSNQAPDIYRAEAVIGITPLRQYLVSMPGGRLQTVDVSYDPRSNEWFNAFGDENRQPHEWGFWKNRSMTWNVQCAFCHMTGFEKKYDAPSDSYASTWKAMGISCAQCHNVKQDAIDTTHTDTNTCPMLESRVVADGLAVVADIPTNRVMDNCASCHSRREELFGTFRAGDNYHDHFRLALPDTPQIFHADGQVLDEDFEYGSFAMSRMGHKGVTCLDCHNPHSGKLTAPYEDNSLCLRCHTPPGLNGAIAIDPVQHSFHKPGTVGSRCVDCHMPVHYYMVRDGRRDHGFTSPDPRLTIEHGIPNACTMCHADKTAEWADDLTVQWYGEKMDQRRSRRRARAVARAQAGDAAIGDEVLALAQTEEIAAWRAALNGLLAGWSSRDDVATYLEHEVTNDHPLVRSSAIRALQGRSNILIKHTALLDDPSALVRIDGAWSGRGAIRPTATTLKELRAYLDNISDQPAGALRQAQFFASSGDTASAEAWATKALLWDPTEVPHYALGRIQYARGNIAGAASNIAQAALMATNSSEYSFALALLYSETGQTEGGMRWLEETVARDPRFGRAWYNLGLAYSQAKRLDDAVKSLLKAEELMPGSSDPAYALATIYFRRGQWKLAGDAAQRCLDIDPSHPSAQQLYAEATKRLAPH